MPHRYTRAGFLHHTGYCLVRLLATTTTTTAPLLAALCVRWLLLLLPVRVRCGSTAARRWIHSTACRFVLRGVHAAFLRFTTLRDLGSLPRTYNGALYHHHTFVRLCRTLPPLPPLL